MTTCRLLHVEDSSDDAELLVHALREASFAFTLVRVETEVEYVAELDAALPDAILCDYSLPEFSAERALEIVRSRGLHLPFIIVSHHIGDTAAVVAMQNGASDYLPKRDLGRLPKAIESALDRSHARRERARAQEALRESNQQLRTMSERLLALQEEERRNIARELHDDIGQTLGALKIGLHRMAGASAEQQEELVSGCLAAASDAIAKVRQIAMELRPPQLDQLGLGDALEWLAQQQGAASGLSITCSFSGLEVRPPPGLEIACYRIAQEALNNVTRHASATRVTIGVESSGSQLKLAVHDDGIGFEEDAALRRVAKSGSMGLIGMAERAQLAGGRLKLWSAPGEGTTINAVFPLVDDTPAKPMPVSEVVES